MKNVKKININCPFILKRPIHDTIINRMADCTTLFDTISQAI